MEYISILFIISIFSITLSIIFNKKIEVTIPVSVTAIVLVVYIFGIFDKLLWGIYAVEILTILQIIYIGISIYFANKKKEIKQLFNNIITPGLLIYVVLVSVVAILNKGKIFEDYDEFNHWAVIIKNMFQNNQYGINADSVINYSEYPPFTAIFQYLVLKLKGTYSEDVIITAQSILYFSIIIPITQNVTWKKIQIKDIAMILGMICIPMILKPTFYTDILVDAIIGVMFAYTIYNIYRKEENIIYKMIMIFSGLLMLSLTKTSGLGLAFLAIGFVILRICTNKDKKENLKLFSVFMILWIILVGLWYGKVGMENANTNWNFHNIVDRNVITSELETKKEIMIRFITSILYTSNIVTEKGLTVLSVVLVILAINILIFRNLPKENREKYKKFAIYMFVCTILYYIILLYMYLTIFDVSEATTLTSLGRYSMTILLADVVFNFYILYEEKIKMDKYISFVIIVFMIMFLPVSTITEKYVNGIEYNKVAQNNRDIMTKIEKYREGLSKDDKIYYVAGIETDLPKLLSLTRYVMMPINIEDITLGLGLDKKTFSQNILDEGYTHIYIYRVPEMKEDIQSIFEDKKIKRDTLYQVEKINEKEIKLVEVK